MSDTNKRLPTYCPPSSDIDLQDMRRILKRLQERLRRRRKGNVNNPVPQAPAVDGIYHDSNERQPVELQAEQRERRTSMVADIDDFIQHAEAPKQRQEQPVKRIDKGKQKALEITDEVEPSVVIPELAHLIDVKPVDPSRSMRNWTPYREEPGLVYPTAPSMNGVAGPSRALVNGWPLSNTKEISPYPEDQRSETMVYTPGIPNYSYPSYSSGHHTYHTRRSAIAGPSNPTAARHRADPIDSHPTIDGSSTTPPVSLLTVSLSPGSSVSPKTIVPPQTPRPKSWPATPETYTNRATGEHFILVSPPPTPSPTRHLHNVELALETARNLILDLHAELHALRGEKEDVERALEKVYEEVPDIREVAREAMDEIRARDARIEGLEGENAGLRGCVEFGKGVLGEGCRRGWEVWRGVVGLREGRKRRGKGEGRRSQDGGGECEVPEGFHWEDLGHCPSPSSLSDGVGEGGEAMQASGSTAGEALLGDRDLDVLVMIAEQNVRSLREGVAEMVRLVQACKGWATGTREVDDSREM